MRQINKLNSSHAVIFAMKPQSTEQSSTTILTSSSNPASHSLPNRSKANKHKNAAERTSSRRKRRSSLNETRQRNQRPENARPHEILTAASNVSESHSYGLSKSLSTESVRNACEFYDDELSDDDLRDWSTDSRKQSSFRRSFKAHCFGNARKKDKNAKEQLLYAMCDTGVSTPEADVKRQVDDAICVLDELDAILDTHETSQQTLGSNELDSKIEDCLLELDSYLEQMDDASIGNENEHVPMQEDIASLRDVNCEGNRRMHTLPINRSSHKVSDPGGTSAIRQDALTRGSALRKTISCGVQAAIPSTSQTSTVESTTTKPWRRNSMRRTAPLALSSNDLRPSATQHAELTNDDNIIMQDTDVASTTADIASIRPEAFGPFRRCQSQHHFSASAFVDGGNETLTPEQILHNLLREHASNATFADRPRQFGRRAEGFAPMLPHNLEFSQSRDSNNSSSNCTIISHEQRRPFSAPATTTVPGGARTTDESDDLTLPEQRMPLYVGSEGSSLHSSRNHSPITVASSSDSLSTTPSTQRHTESQLGVCVGMHDALDAPQTALDPDNVPLHTHTGMNSKWPHSYGRTLALVCCTLGLFNTCRFAILTINYGGNFVLQFLLLSLLFGIPLFWLQMCLGAKIKSGPVSMWKISPICRGIGIALLTVHCLMAIYSTAVVGWLVSFLCDSFFVPRNASSATDRWPESPLAPSSNKLSESVAYYFNLVILQRLHLISNRHGPGEVTPRLAFYVVIIWVFVFLILCKGLKTLGKFIFPLALLPLIALVAVTGKFLYTVDRTKLQNIFSADDFDEFLVNSKSWTAAAQETFLTWGLMGASVIAVTSRSSSKANSMYTLRRDAIVSVLITLFGLAVAALLGLCCMQILTQNAYVYVPGSYEYPSSYVAVYIIKDAPNTSILSFPPKWVPHYSSFIGEIYRRPTTLQHHDRESGYQALRFISELFPMVSALTVDSISWVWITVTFATFAVLGLAQLCVMWKPISSVLGNSTSSVLASCITGLLLSIPFATQGGINILHYMDVLFGGSWFIPLLWTALIFGVFLIRGRPYNGDDLVNDLKMSGSMSAFLALSWNVLLPIGLITLSIVDFKASQSNQFYHWRGKSYFSYWARKVGGLTQISLLLLLPVTALIQIYRYIANGPPDLLDRIQLLYRPSLDPNDQRRGGNSSVRRNDQSRGGLTGSISGMRHTDSNAHQLQEDAPPKYTPPPSYTTATGARLAKIFRHSLRRSVRRILGAPGSSGLILPSVDMEQNMPPNYSNVLSLTADTMNTTNLSYTEAIEIEERPRPQLIQHALTLGSHKTAQKAQGIDVSQRPASAPRTLETLPGPQRPCTAEDVVTLLRSSMRRRQERNALERQQQQQQHQQHQQQQFDEDEMQSRDSHRSVENLILNAEPVGLSPAVIDIDGSADSTEQHTINSEGHNSSVI